jgi:hypothetical protein
VHQRAHGPVVALQHRLALERRLVPHLRVNVNVIPVLGLSCQLTSVRCAEPSSAQALAARSPPAAVRGCQPERREQHEPTPATRSHGARKCA